MEPTMKSSYKKEDVTLLLKDISGLVRPQPAAEREKLIQSGTHYSEMLPLEYRPSPKYMESYQAALESFGEDTAKAVAAVSKKILAAKGPKVVLVSLARAGVPVGILIKHYMAKYFDVNPVHYAISIIRGRGIDENAIRYILERHKAEDVQFVDGWIGKGAILGELAKAAKPWQKLSPDLAVLADPANMTELCGTHRDILIPSSCLNSTVSGLISRTFLRKDIIGPEDFHGAAYYKELAGEDLSQQFLEAIESKFAPPDFTEEPSLEGKGIDEVRQIAAEYKITDVNLIKPGIGEATRVLLRRLPERILIKEGMEERPELTHLLRLAEEKGVLVEKRRMKHYLACGIIRNLQDV